MQFFDSDIDIDSLLESLDTRIFFNNQISSDRSKLGEKNNINYNPKKEIS